MTEVLAIGGSAGSLPVITDILNALPADFNYAIIIVLHRLKNVFSEMDKVLVNYRTDLTIKEPEDKEPVKKHHIYLAPQNYHLLVEEEKTFSLDYSELVNHSRPSIDVTFDSLARVYGPLVTCILLSGANRDGATGLHKVIEHGGIGIVQDPETAEYTSMPLAAIQLNKKITIQTPEEIVNYIRIVNMSKK
ncbi:MAG: chemotaxis protein CheB [Flavipsychrobacter sp.]|nr:chemotaxis protein CheB [Flavipsychrobacter sp.]